MMVEDFAFMPEDRSGCYDWFSNGPDDNGRILHSAWFDFNDEVLQPFGASCFASSVEARRNQYLRELDFKGRSTRLYPVFQSRRLSKIRSAPAPGPTPMPCRQENPTTEWGM